MMRVLDLCINTQETQVHLELQGLLEPQALVKGHQVAE